MPWRSDEAGPGGTGQVDIPRSVDGHGFGRGGADRRVVKDVLTGWVQLQDRITFSPEHRLSDGQVYILLASMPKARVVQLATQMENAIAVPVGLNLVTKAQPLVSEGAPRAVDVSGKSGESVEPATYCEPEESTAIPLTISEYKPPR